MKNVFLTSLLTGFVLMSSPGLAQNAADNAEDLSGLPIGAVAPLSTLVNENGEQVSLTDDLKKGPVILVFYRGEWCPVCNRFLSGLQDSLALLEEKGAILYAVSAEKPEYLRKMKAKTKTSFGFLSDSAYVLMQDFGLVYALDGVTTAKYKLALGADFTKATGTTEALLPVPATYIIGMDGKVMWRHFDPDYRKRATVKSMLDALH